MHCFGCPGLNMTHGYLVDPQSCDRALMIWPVKTLTHWGRVTHIYVGNLTTIGPDNGLSPSRRQAIIWTNAGILLIGPWGRKFSEILIGIQTYSFKKMHLKMSSAKWRPFCLGLNELTHFGRSDSIWRHRPGSTLVLACRQFGVS